MSQDPQTYERAVGGSLLGLGVQAAAAGVLLGLGLWTGDPAVLAGAWLAAAGLPVWIVLAIVHQQHRLERIEALEAEELAKRPGVEQTIFERTTADLSVARRRLDQLFKWALPAVSLLVGLYLAGAGLWLAIQNAPKPGVRAEPHALGFDPLVAMAFCAGLGLVGFLVGRFVAGMARVREWQLMRGGAGFLMSAVVCAAALTFGLAGAKYELPALQRWLAVVIPIFMILIGAEVLLNLVLNVYRPRKPGETPRAAFDARLLGLLTTPEGLAKAFADAVNYQFGFEITHSWFWQLLGRAALPLLGFAVGALLLASCLVHVEPSQQALVTTFGRLDGEPLGPGLHLKWPWPLSSFELFDVTRVHEVRVGSIEDLKPGEPVLWTNEHSAKDEGLLIVAASPLATPNAGSASNRAPAIALVVAEVSVQYRIKDLKQFVACGAAASVEAWLKCSAERAVTAYLYGLDEQEVLGPARLQAGDRLRERIQRDSDANGLGIEVIFAGILSAHPHHKAAEAFHESVQALQERETKIEQAQQERIKTLSQVAGSPDQAAKLVAEIGKLDRLKNEGAKPEEIATSELAAERAIREGSGEASQELAKAEADRWTRENAERGKAERFLKELLSYQQAPKYFVARRYLEVVSEGLGSDKVRKYVLAAERDKLTVRMDLKDQDLDLPMNLTPEK